MIYSSRLYKVKSIKDKFVEVLKNEYYPLIMAFFSFGVSYIFLIIYLELFICNNIIWLSYIFYFKKYDNLCKY